MDIQSSSTDWRAGNEDDREQWVRATFFFFFFFLSLLLRPCQFLSPLRPSSHHLECQVQSGHRRSSDTYQGILGVIKLLLGLIQFSLILRYCQAGRQTDSRVMNIQALNLDFIQRVIGRRLLLATSFSIVEDGEAYRLSLGTKGDSYRLEEKRYL